MKDKILRIISSRFLRLGQTILLILIFCGLPIFELRDTLEIKNGTLSQVTRSIAKFSGSNLAHSTSENVEVGAPCNPDLRSGQLTEVLLNNEVQTNYGMRSCVDVLAEPPKPLPQNVAEFFKTDKKKSALAKMKAQLHYMVSGFYDGVVRSGGKTYQIQTPVCNMFASASIPNIFGNSEYTDPPPAPFGIEWDSNHRNQDCGAWPTFKAKVGAQAFIGSVYAIPPGSKMWNKMKTCFNGIMNGPFFPNDPIQSYRVNGAPNLQLALDSIRAKNESEDADLSLGENAILLQCVKDEIDDPPPNSKGNVCYVSRTELFSAREMAYFSGAKVHSYNCYYQKVLNEILATKKLTIQGGTSSVCSGLIEDFNQLQLTTKQSLDKMRDLISTHAQIPKIENCDEATRPENLAPLGSVEREMTMSACTLFSKRLAVESQFAWLSVCEVLARAKISQKKFFEDIVIRRIPEKMISKSLGIRAVLSSYSNSHDLLDIYDNQIAGGATLCHDSYKKCKAEHVLGQCFKPLFRDIIQHIASNYWTPNQCQ